MLLAIDNPDVVSDDIKDFIINYFPFKAQQN